MLNTLDDYIWRSLPEDGDFCTNPGLTAKVDADGRILPYAGNTTVFLVDEAAKLRLAQLQDGLYAAAPELLAERLRPETFHMTLHSLEDGGPDRPGLSELMRAAQERARPLLEGWRSGEPIRMRATWLFNMVNTSVVLGLAPADAGSYERLDAMYAALEAVKPLGYAMTPHITMAYYRPGCYARDQVEALRAALRPVELELTLGMDGLVLQDFADMNSYVTVF